MLSIGWLLLTVLCAIALIVLSPSPKASQPIAWLALSCFVVGFVVLQIVGRLKDPVAPGQSAPGGNGAPSVISTPDGSKHLGRDALTIPRLTAGGIILSHPVGFATMAAIFTTSAGLLGWLILAGEPGSGFEVFLWGSLVGIGFSSILVWAALFGPLYVNPSRLRAIESLHTGSRAWAIFQTDEFRAYVDDFSPQASPAWRARSKSFLSLGAGKVVFWYRDGSTIRSFMSVDRQDVLKALAEDVDYGVDPQPGVVLTVKTGEGLTGALSFIPAPKGFERRGTTASEVAGLLVAASTKE